MNARSGIRTLVGHALGSLLLALVSALGCAGGGSGGGDSESHFLSTCNSSCGDGTSCVCDVCSSSCETEADCAAFSPLAVCVPAGCAEASGVCEVLCTAEGDCTSLGAQYACSDGRCRWDDARATARSSGDTPADAPETNPSMSSTGAIAPATAPTPVVDEVPTLGPLIEPSLPPSPLRRTYVANLGPEPMFQPHLIDGNLLYQSWGGLSIVEVAEPQSTLLDVYPVAADAIGMLKEGDELRMVFGGSTAFPNAETLEPTNPLHSARVMRFDVSDPADIRLLEERWLEGTIDGMRVLDGLVYAVFNAGAVDGTAGRMGRVYDLQTFDLLTETPLTVPGFSVGLGPDFLALKQLGGSSPDNYYDISIIGFDDGNWSQRGETARIDGLTVGNPHLAEGVLYVPTDSGDLNPIDTLTGELLDQEAIGSNFLTDVLFTEQFAYVAKMSDPHRLAVYDVSLGPAMLLSQIEMEPRMTNLTLVGDRLFGFGHDAQRLQSQAASFDVSDPTAPVLEQVVDFDVPPPTNGITGRPWGPLTVVDEANQRIATAAVGGEEPDGCSAEEPAQPYMEGVQWFSYADGLSAEEFVALSRPVAGSLTMIDGAPFNLTGRMPEPARQSLVQPSVPSSLPSPYRFAGSDHTYSVRTDGIRILEVSAPSQATAFNLTARVPLPRGYICGVEQSEIHWAQSDGQLILAVLNEIDFRAELVYFDVSDPTPNVLGAQTIPLQTRFVYLALTPTHLVIDEWDPTSALTNQLQVYPIDPGGSGDPFLLDGDLQRLPSATDSVLVRVDSNLFVYPDDFSAEPMRFAAAEGMLQPALLQGERLLARRGVGYEWFAPEQTTPLSSAALSPTDQASVLPIDDDRAFVVVPGNKPETQTWFDDHEVYVLSGMSSDALTLSEGHTITLHEAERSVVVGQSLLAPGLSDGLLVLNHDGNWTEQRVETGIKCGDLSVVGDQVVCNAPFGVALSTSEFQ